MCLGIAGRIVSFDANRPDVARVEVQGVARDINIALLDDLKVDDWILIHLGFALEKMTPEEAADSIDILRQLGPTAGAEDDGRAYPWEMGAPATEARP